MNDSQIEKCLLDIVEFLAEQGEQYDMSFTELIGVIEVAKLRLHTCMEAVNEGIAAEDLERTEE